MMPLKWRYARARETSWHRLISVWKGKGVGEPSRNEVRLVSISSMRRTGLFGPSSCVPRYWMTLGCLSEFSIWHSW